MQQGCCLLGFRIRCCSQHASAPLPASLGAAISDPEALLRVDVDVSLGETGHHAHERGDGVRAEISFLTLGFVSSWQVEFVAYRAPGMLQP